MQVAGRTSPWGTLIGLEVEVAEGGSARCVLEADQRHHNSNGVVHGAVPYALVDTAMGAALYSTLGQGGMAATVEIKVSYFKPVRAGRVHAEARVIHRSRQLATLEAEVIQGGELVAKALGTFRILKDGGEAP